MTPLLCPAGHPNCRTVSYPLLNNNIFWQNRAYYIGVGALSASYQQNIVTLYNAFTSTQAPNQPQADAPQPMAQGRSSPEARVPVRLRVTGTSAFAATPDRLTMHHNITLAPTYSVLTDAAADYGAAACTTPQRIRLW